MASQLFKLLAKTTDDPVEKPVEKKPEPAEPAAAPAAAPAEKPIKVRKPKPVVETPPPIPKEEPVAPVVKAPVAAAPVQSDEDFEKDLVDEEREQLETARRAEKLFGEKHKGLAERTKKFLKENAEKVSAPDFDEEDPEYQRWLKANMPKLTPMEVRKVDMDRIREEVKKESASESENLRHEMYVRDEEPKIRQAGNKIHQELSNIALPEEVTAAFTARSKELGDPQKAIKEVQEEYKLEFEIAENIVNTATADIEEFHRLTTTNPQTQRSIREFEPQNPQHERILKMVTEVCEEFKAEGGEQLKRDGRWFATRREWQSIPADQRKNWWTFDNKEIIERAKKHVPLAVQFTVKAERERLEKKGFVRPAKTIAPPIPPPSAPMGAPAAPRPAPVPGAGSGTTLSPGEILAQRLQTK